MLVSEFLTAVRERVDIPASSSPETTGRIINPTIRRYMNEGLRRSARITKGLRGKGTVSVVAGTQEYTFNPTNGVIETHKASFSPTGENRDYPVEYRDYGAGDEVWGSSRTITTYSHPTNYWMWGNPPTLTIGLYPTPSVGGTLTIHYYRLPTETAEDATDDASTIDWVTGWEDVVVDYAAFKVLQKDKRLEEALVVRQEWQEGLAQFADATARHTDEPIQTVHNVRGVMGQRGLVPLSWRG